MSFETPRCCESHDKPAAHQYTVTIDDVTEELMACTCPHHVHRNAYCKHMAAVEGATDDGTLTAFPSEDDDDTEPDDCDCDGLSDFPCWSCVRTGRKELPN
ncbi:SWIM zinc finger family protein [Haladaptatus litoreus]|uniref:SWIM zinc finger family protein n=1 Tax=Haladaptatus litoreus TaxID=553468 RepID=UPI001C37D9C9|nr:SWIM zinc finger family protein [Haladaptatus litoreus]